MHGRKYTREDILAGVKEAYEKGYDLRPSKIQKSPYWRFYKSKMLPKYFGNWKGALAAAGISYDEFEHKVKVDKIVRQNIWNRTKVKESILQRYRQGKDLNAAKVSAEQSDLCHAMRNYFGSHDNALKYAGLDPDKIRKISKPHTDNEIINTVKTAHAEGKDLNESRIKVGDDVKLKRIVYAAQQRFGSWEKAVEMAGIDYGAYRIRERSWSKAKVLDRIKDLRSRNEPLDSTYISDKYNRLYHAAYRYVGGWEAAVMACGIDYKAISKKQGISLSREEIIAYIKKLHRKRYDLSASSIESDKKAYIRRLYRQSITKFGSWNNALEKAGADYNKIRKEHKKYTISGLVKIVRNLRSNGVRIEQEYIRNDKQNKKYFSAVTKRMKWSEFMDKIGPRPLSQELASLANESEKFKNSKTLGFLIYQIAKKYHKTADEVWDKYHRMTHVKKGDAETDAEKDYYDSVKEVEDEGENL